MHGIVYHEPGKYIAILNSGRFPYYYVKAFDFPAGEYAEAGAAWYYLNRVDLYGCVEAIYPKEIFEHIFKPKEEPA